MELAIRAEVLALRVLITLLVSNLGNILRWNTSNYFKTVLTVRRGWVCRGSVIRMTREGSERVTGSRGGRRTVWCGVVSSVADVGSALLLPPPPPPGPGL